MSAPVPATTTLMNQSDGAMDALADDLIEEVFEHADRFLRSDDKLNFGAIFRWLVEIEANNEGLVTEATVGTRGSKWLLARKLGDTLQSTVDQIMFLTTAERAMQDMANVFAYAAVMNLWNLNDNLNEEGPIGEVLKPSKMHGLE